MANTLLIDKFTAWARRNGLSTELYVHPDQAAMVQAAPRLFERTPFVSNETARAWVIFSAGHSVATGEENKHKVTAMLIALGCDDPETAQRHTPGELSDWVKMQLVAAARDGAALGDSEDKAEDKVYVQHIGQKPPGGPWPAPQMEFKLADADLSLDLRPTSDGGRFLPEQPPEPPSLRECMQAVLRLAAAMDQTHGVATRANFMKLADAQAELEAIVTRLPA